MEGLTILAVLKYFRAPTSGPASQLVLLKKCVRPSKKYPSHAPRPFQGPRQGTKEFSQAIYCWVRHLIKQKVRPSAAIQLRTCAGRTHHQRRALLHRLTESILHSFARHTSFPQGNRASFFPPLTFRKTIALISPVSKPSPAASAFGWRHNIYKAGQNPNRR